MTSPRKINPLASFSYSTCRNKILSKEQTEAVAYFDLIVKYNVARIKKYLEDKGKVEVDVDKIVMIRNKISEEKKKHARSFLEKNPDATQRDVIEMRDRLHKCLEKNW
jgi:hypothetical protein